MHKAYFMNRKYYVICCLLFNSLQSLAQDKQQITLEQCYTWAASNSSLAQQKALTITAGNMAERNQNLKWLPQLDLNAHESIATFILGHLKFA